MICIKKELEKENLEIMNGIYDVLKLYGSQKFAIENAKKLLKEGSNYASMKPATTVFKLVELLEGMLGSD